MSIERLPQELIRHIIVIGGHTKSKFLTFECIVNNKEDLLRELMALRIQLAYKIHTYYKILKSYIFSKLDIVFRNIGHWSKNVEINKIPNIITRKKDRGTCVYYAPHTPHGRCRSCWKHEDFHFMSHEIIDNYYIDLYIMRCAKLEAI